MKSQFISAAVFCLVLALLPGKLLALTGTGFFPANNATAVCADTPLKITFDSAPTVGTAGAVRIHNSGGTLVDTLDLGSPQTRTVGGTVYNSYHILVTGNTASIFPHSGVLAYNTTYYVTIDATVFPGYAGLSGTTAWRFTTRTAAPSSAGTYFTVAADGTGDFCTVQGAVDLIPSNNLTKRYINIRNGTYQEIVRASSKHNLAFRGQNRKRTIIAYPNNSNLNASTNTRPLFNVVANDVSFDNLTLHNTTPDGGSQAEALRVNAQRCVVNNCDLRSYQDTFLVNSATDTAYFKDSLIEGDADFIWGTGRAVFQSCEIKSLDGGFVCAMRNPAGQYGAVFLDCRFTRSAGVTGVVFGRVDPSVFPDSAVAVVNCAVDAHITAAGWTLSAAGPTTGLRYWEYQSTDLSGAPLSVTGRASFSSQINSTQATALRNLSTTFGGWTPIPPLPAFPGAEGAGANTLGGRGGDVYFVTNLNDSGPGSLREGITTAPASGRTILFTVSGTIALNSNLTVNKPRITIAGQSAPGGGICLKNWTLRVDANDIVIRHIRSRLGTDANREDDAITVWNSIYVILDHCSASWSVDEVFSCTGKTDNLTTQWCYVTEALDDSIHSKGPHGFGSIVASYLPGRLSWHHNLYAHNQSRNPRPGSYDGSTINFDFRNNVLYNWGYFCGYSAGSPEATDMNYIGNYLIKGPGSTTDSAFRGGGTSTRIYQSGNKIDLNKNAAFDGADTGWAMFGGTYTQQTAAFDFNQTNTPETADLALQRVLSQAGAMPWNRDTKDSAIAANVVAGTGGFVDSSTEAGGYPALASTAYPPDNDLDGIPNILESAFGSDPNVANHNADADADGYTDIEEYLNWLAAPHATTPKDETVDIDLLVRNGNRTGLTYTVANPVNGTVTLLPDGRTARFTPTPGFQGLGSFNFSFTASGQSVVQTVGVAITTGPPKDLTWSGATATWDIGTTANFTNGASAATYTQGDNVSFLQTGSNPTINVSGTITPTTMTVNATKNYVFNGGTLSGTMNLVKAGSGSLTLNAANAFTGGASITGGSVVLGNAAALGTGPVSFDNAALNMAGFTVANPVSFTGTSTVTGDAYATLRGMSGDGAVNLNISSSPFGLGGDMSGFRGVIAIAGNFYVRLLSGITGSAAATFDLGNGTGYMNVRNNLPAVAIGALKGGTNTILYGQSNDNLPTTFTIGGNDQDCTFSGGIRNGASGASAITSVTKTGAGTLTLAGTSNYTGATLVNEGTLRVTGALGATAVTVADGAALTGTGSIGGSVLVQAGGSIASGSGGAGTLTIGGGLTLNDTALTFDLNNSTTTGGGVNDLYTIGGALNLSGTIIVTPNLLNGPLAAGTYTLISGGSSTVNNAILVWGGSPNGGRQNVAFDTSVPGTLKLIVTGTPSATLFWIGTPGSTWDSGDPFNPAIGAANWRNGVAPDRFVKYDTVTFDDTLTNGTAVLSGNVEPASVTVNNTTKTVTINSSAGSMVGETSFVKNGSGTLTLDGANTYSGGTILNAGTIQLASDNANTNAFGSGPITLKGGTLAMYSNFNATTSSNTSTWDLVVPTGFTGTLNCDSRCAIRGFLTGGGTLNLYIPDIRTGIDADWSAFTGQINVTTDANGGEFRIGNNYSPTGLPLAAMNLASNVKLLYVAIVDSGAGSKVALGSLTGAAGSILQGGPTTGRTFTWEIGQADTDSIFQGTISEQAPGCITALNKVGTGMLKLTATCGHAGPITVSGGSLVVNGDITASPLAVNASALLGGTGSLAATTINSDATLSPGENGPGVLTFTNGLTLAAESVTAFDLGSTRDRVDVTGNLTLNGIINFTNAGGLLPGTYTIFNYTGTLGGSGLAIGSVPPDFGCTLDTATTGQVKVVVTTTLSAFQQWQVLWFGDYNNPEAAPGEDPDLDGQTNNDEFIAGTDPTSAASVATLYWRGDGTGNLWDLRTSATFWNGNRLSIFTNGNPVVFDASGAANPTVNLSGSLSPVSVSVNNTATMTFTGSGNLAGTGSLTKSGTGTLNLQTANSHTGLTSVNGGIVNLSGNQAGATGGYALNVVNSATSTLNLGSASQTAATTVVTGVSKSIQLGAIPGVNTATSTSAQTVNVNGAAGFPTTVSNTGSLAVARNATLNLGSHVAWTQTGAVNVQANGGYGANLNIGPTAGSNAAMTYTGTSPIQLSQTASTSSVSALTIRGILTTGQPVHFNGASGNANGYGRLILTSGGTLKLSASIPQLVTGDASGRFILSNGGGGIIDTNDFNTSIDRVLADSSPVTFIGSLAKTGAGTLTLSNTNTYTGSTTVTGGTLLVNGGIASSATTVYSSGTLGGTGTTGPLTVESGGTLAPGGENPGTLATGPLTLKAGSSCIFRLGSSGDRVNAGGNLTLGGAVTLIDTGSAISGSHTLFTHTGNLSGTAVVNPPPGFAAMLDTSTPGVVKVTLIANSYATWSRDNFTSTELANPSISGQNATPAGDGLSNLLKYALGLPPKTPSTTGITLRKPAGAWLFTYTRPANRQDITYAVEVSTDLESGSWTSAGVNHQRILTGDPETWQATSTPGATGKLFWRLKVSQP